MGIRLEAYRQPDWNVNLPAPTWAAIGKRVGGILGVAVLNWSRIEGHSLAVLAAEVREALGRMNHACLEEKETRTILFQIVEMAEDAHMHFGELIWW